MREHEHDGAYTAEIQGNVLRGFRFPHARFLFVAFTSPQAGRDWVRGLRVTDGRKWKTPRTRASALTVAFTHRGLAALEVDKRLLDQFPKAFHQGMRQRRALIGDADKEGSWDRVFRDDSIHALVSLYGKDPVKLDAKVRRLCLGGAVVRLDVQPAALLPGAEDSEHFGFRDGISQPIQHDPATRGWKSDVPIGEFLVFPSRWNEGRSKPGDPGLALGELGTYLVYRKLEQHVDRFRRFLQGWPAGFGPELVAAKMVGRWPNGTPVTEGELDPKRREQPDDTNDFDFSKDRDGRRCPFGAHISRVNPRERLPVSAAQHRILRRGMPYGARVAPGWGVLTKEAAAGQRGLVFIGLNACIENQFEFLQRDWVNLPGFNRLDGSDPIAHSRDARLGNFRLAPGGPFRRLDESFVELRGGEYFFVPSTRALKDLGAGKFSTT